MNANPYIYHLQRKNNPLRSSAISFSCLGKVRATTHHQLQDCKQKLELLCLRSLQQHPISNRPLVIGLAESGILLSAIMHQILLEQEIEAHWICSTRRMINGIPFTESHSHEPHHVLPFPDCQPTELWFVEDEVTTGKTVCHLAIKLCKLFDIQRIRLFALADSRSPEELLGFQRVLAQYEIICFTETEHKINKNTQMMPAALAVIPQELSHPKNHDLKPIGWHLPSLRPALKSQANSSIDVSHQLKGSLLVVGEAIDLALKIIQNNPALSLQHITLSPWEIDQKSILSCLEIKDRYYLYNYEQLKSPIYFLADPLDQEIEQSARELLLKLGFEIAELNALIAFS